MLSNTPMFTVYGWRELSREAIQPVQAAFMEDGSLRELKGDADLLIGSWQWLHEECCIEVLIPGRIVSLQLDTAVTEYLSWLAKQVVN